MAENLKVIIFKKDLNWYMNLETIDFGHTISGFRNRPVTWKKSDPSNIGPAKNIINKPGFWARRFSFKNRKIAALNDLDRELCQVLGDIGKGKSINAIAKIEALQKKVRSILKGAQEGSNDPAALIQRRLEVILRRADTKVLSTVQNNIPGLNDKVAEINAESKKELPYQAFAFKPWKIDSEKISETIGQVGEKVPQRQKIYKTISNHLAAPLNNFQQGLKDKNYPQLFQAYQAMHDNQDLQTILREQKLSLTDAFKIISPGDNSLGDPILPNLVKSFEKIMDNILWHSDEGDVVMDWDAGKEMKAFIDDFKETVSLKPSSRKNSPPDFPEPLRKAIRDHFGVGVYQKKDQTWISIIERGRLRNTRDIAPKQADLIPEKISTHFQDQNDPQRQFPCCQQFYGDAIERSFPIRICENGIWTDLSLVADRDERLKKFDEYLREDTFKVSQFCNQMTAANLCNKKFRSPSGELECFANPKVSVDVIKKGNEIILRFFCHDNAVRLMDKNGEVTPDTLYHKAQFTFDLKLTQGNPLPSLTGPVRFEYDPIPDLQALQLEDLENGNPKNEATSFLGAVLAQPWGADYLSCFMKREDDNSIKFHWNGPEHKITIDPQQPYNPQKAARNPWVMCFESAVLPKDNRESIAIPELLTALNLGRYTFQFVSQKDNVDKLNDLKNFLRDHQGQAMVYFHEGRYLPVTKIKDNQDSFTIKDVQKKGLSSTINSIDPVNNPPLDQAQPLLIAIDHQSRLTNYYKETFKKLLPGNPSYEILAGACQFYAIDPARLGTKGLAERINNEIHVKKPQNRDQAEQIVKPLIREFVETKNQLLSHLSQQYKGQIEKISLEGYPQLEDIIYRFDIPDRDCLDGLINKSKEAVPEFVTAFLQASQKKSPDYSGMVQALTTLMDSFNEIMAPLNLTNPIDRADFMISVFNLGLQESPQNNQPDFYHSINSQPVQDLRETLKGLNPELTAVKFLEGMAKQGNQANHINIPQQEPQIEPQAAPVPLDPQVQNEILAAINTEIDEKPFEPNQSLTARLQSPLKGKDFQEKGLLKTNKTDKPITGDTSLKVCQAFDDPRHDNVTLVDENDNSEASLKINDQYTIDERREAYNQFNEFCDKKDDLNLFLSQYLVMHTFASVFKENSVPVKFAGDNFIVIIGNNPEKSYRVTKLKNGDFKFNLTMANPRIERISTPDGLKQIDLDPEQSQAFVSLEFVYPYSQHQDLDPQNFKDISVKISYTLVPKTAGAVENNNNNNDNNDNNNNNENNDNNNGKIEFDLSLEDYLRQIKNDNNDTKDN